MIILCNIEVRFETFGALHATVSLDEQMFANGQAYVAMSRAKSWENLEIRSFNPDAIKVDNEMLLELDRLQQQFNNMHSLYLRSEERRVGKECRYRYELYHK